MRIIGITGTLGAGKGTIVEYLKTKGFQHVAVSDTFLAGEALLRGLVSDRITRRNIANEFRSEGPTKLMDAVYTMALPALKAGKDVIIEPQHTVAEVEFIQLRGGLVFAIDADLKTRYERIRKRGGEKDKVSFEHFAEAQKIEMGSSDPNKNNLAAAMAKADYHFTNDGTPKELHTALEKVLVELNEKSVTKHAT